MSNGEKTNFKGDTYFLLFKKIQNFPDFFGKDLLCFLSKNWTKKIEFSNFGDQKLKKKVFS